MKLAKSAEEWVAGLRESYAALQFCVIPESAQPLLTNIAKYAREAKR
jgi:hypothetical protein